MSNLTNEQKAIYAILADNVYWDVRSDDDKDKVGDYTQSNWTPVPDGWTVIDEISGSGTSAKENSNLDGFTARAYKKVNEIVISYAGT